jgi:hypothetical protein
MKSRIKFCGKCGGKLEFLVVRFDVYNGRPITEGVCKNVTNCVDACSCDGHKYFHSDQAWEWHEKEDRNFNRWKYILSGFLGDWNKCDRCGYQCFVGSTESI